MARQTIQQKLKALQKDWKNTEARTGYEDLPDGDYEGIIKNAVLGLSKNDNLMATYTLEVAEPEDFKGRTQYKRQMVETADNIAYAKGDLGAIGVDIPENIADLGNTFEQEVIGLPLLFSVSHNKEFVNVYFRERLEGKKQDGEPDDDDDNEGEDTLTAEDVRSYLDEDDEGESLLSEIIKDNELDIDPDEYTTWSEVADLIIDQLSLE